MKRLLSTLAIFATLAVCQMANATPVTHTYADTALNWDTWTATSNNNYDPYGTPDIASTSVTTDNGSLQNITFNLAISNFSVKSGDLFINTGADHTWDYVVRSLGATLNGTASLGLFALGGLDYDSATADRDNYQMSYYIGGSYRSGLPIGLSSDMGTLLGNIDYSANAKGISFDFNGLLNLSNFIVGYQVSCANDVVYQQVPEPGSLLLLGAGLVGLAIVRKRRNTNLS